MPSALVLIGTVHHDPRGYAKLFSALSILKPDFITLEFSPYGRGFRTRHAKRLSQRLVSLCRKKRASGPASPAQHDVLTDAGDLPSAVQALLLTLNYPFEFLAARDYAYVCRVPFYCIDLSGVSRQKLQLLKHEALSKQNITMLQTLPDKSLHESAELCYKRAQNFCHGNSRGKTAPVANGDASVFIRETHMSRRIRNLMNCHPDKTVVHIGGWEHIAGGDGNKNMHVLLSGFSPQRILLTDDALNALASASHR